MFTFNFDFHNYQNLCPNLQKPPMPWKSPDHAPAIVENLFQIGKKYLPDQICLEKLLPFYK